MKNPEPLFFKESLEWIKTNPNVTTHDLPERFIRHWTHNKDDGSPSSYLWGIFMLGVVLHRTLKNQVLSDGSVNVSENELMDNFYKWQVKISMAEIHQKTDMRLKPLVIFDFPEGESIESISSAGRFKGRL